ncbi:MAG: DUF2461 domain-containing protein [Oscillospiraceae bacterium]|jgi:uncharacterized protein (TIGR02453 family)|nr:DUF2461 domain-containing protein [Oscillospiraceae bacterium]
MDFQGFRPEAQEYLALVKRKDSKPWYDEHKEEQRRLLLEPFAALVTDLAPTFAEIDPALFADPRKSVSRVRRDTRFTKDKHLYRDNMWFTAKPVPGEEWARYPCFWFGLTPVDYSCGLGFYDAGPTVMERFRRAVARDIDGFRAVVAGLAEQFPPQGETYKRDKDPTLPEDIRAWYNRRNLSVERVGAAAESLYTPALAPQLRADFLALAPLYRFLKKAAQEGDLSHP